ncbi:heterokaryon incompatibility protein-domain-containing protein [Xylogone sp. PMI_703]|nr:heterokaryon incompatibility protein-domain-containing protein [Xylogone sp. PMI_703]
MSTSSPSNFVDPTTNLCATCADIFTGEWQPQLRGWKKRPEFPADPLNPQPAFGTAYEHGQMSYVHKSAAPPTLSFPHHDVSALRESASTCPLCRIVARAFDASDKVDNGRIDYMEGRKPKGRDRWNEEEIAGAKGYVFIYTERGKTSKLIFRYHVHQFWKENRSIDVNPLVSEREGNMKDVKLEMYDLADDKNKHFLEWKTQGGTIERLMRWLKEDDSEYTKLLAKLPVRELPTRLLHLEPGSPDPVVRLIDQTSSNVSAETPYIALSHSWGKSVPLQLKSELLETFTTTGIAFGDLPRTFQDAIKLTLQLGVSYIWIDSLCIIQDSTSDWLHEAQRMATVYTFSYLTIAASASISSATGLTPIRPHPQTVIVQPTWTGWIREWGLTSNQTLRIDDPWPDIFFHSIISAPLNQRGWTYQEYILSPRILHCTAGEWWWRTISGKYLRDRGIFRETSTELYQFYTGPISLTWPDSRFFYAATDREREYTPTIMVWDRLASQYNQRALTKRRDKLVALGAVAQIFGRILDLPVDKEGEFVAGCWKSHLPLGLVWMAAEKAERYHIEPDDEDANYVIPSWSWASVDGLVRFTDFRSLNGDKVFDGMPEVVDVGVTTLGGPFGPVTSGYIILKGPLFRILASKEVKDLKEHSWYRKFNVLASDGSTVCEQSGNEFCLDSWKSRIDTWDKDREMHFAVLDPKNESGSHYFALLLEKVAGEGRGVYKRIGSSGFNWTGSTDLLQAVKEQGKEMLTSEDYIEVDPESGHYTYKIL